MLIAVTIICDNNTSKTDSNSFHLSVEKNIIIISKIRASEEKVLFVARK